MASKGLENVVSVAAAGVANLNVGGCRTFAVMLIPNGTASGSVTITGSIDGGTTHATLNTTTVAASTNVLLHFVDLPVSHLTISTSGISAGAVTAQVSRLREA